MSWKKRRYTTNKISIMLLSKSLACFSEKCQFFSTAVHLLLPSPLPPISKISVGHQIQPKLTSNFLSLLLGNLVPWRITNISLISLTLLAPILQNGQTHTNYLSVFDRFVGLTLEGLILCILTHILLLPYCRRNTEFWKIAVPLGCGRAIFWNAVQRTILGTITWRCLNSLIKKMTIHVTKIGAFRENYMYSPF